MEEKGKPRAVTLPYPSTTMATIYKHHFPSSTSLSDDNDDDDVQFHDQDRRTFLITPAQWSNKRSIDTIPFKESTHSPMSGLPPEILIHILKHLHSPRDLFSCLRVSRIWCECAVELLWHKPGFPKYDTLEKMSKLLTRPDQSFNYAHFIRRLNFLSLGTQLKDDVFSVFARCDRLERLTLVNCEHISSTALSRILPCFTDLVAIDLSGAARTNNDAIISLALSAKRLQGINLAGCTEVSDAGIITLALNCPLLRRVKLSNLENSTDAAIQALAKCCPLLLEIDLNHCHLITDAAVREIWLNSTYMRELRLSYCLQLTDAAFPAPLRPELMAQTDNANPFPNSKAKLDNELPPLILNRQFIHLRMLDLTACSLITDEAIEGIISQASKIRNLVLSKCSLLTDRSVENICRLGRHLHYLHLGHASKITDRSVRTLARSCTRLRYVDFANCTLLTDMSVFELATLPKLRRIGLVRVNNLTDEAIYALAERHATLERIHLSYCDQISVMAIHFLLQKLHKLTHLSLTGIPAFRQPELQQFCRDPPRDFSAVQQSSFCVFSGKGVLQLRAFLTELFDHMTETNGTDDTEYDEDEFEVDDEILDPETGGEAEDEDITVQELSIHREDILVTGHSQRTDANPTQPQFYQYNRQARSPTVPPSNSPTGIMGSYASGRSAGQALTNSFSNSASHTRAYHRITASVADSFPVIEHTNSASPSASDNGSNHSGGTNNSNGATFFRTYHDTSLAQPSLAVRNEETLTSDLDFAEIGHGRGIQATLQGGSRVQTNNYVTGQYSSEDLNQSWPQHDSSAWGSSHSLITQDGTPAFCASDRRGRSVKKNIRNKLNVAEQYASSFFGRSAHDDNSRRGGGGRTEPNLL
ncbi:hypothetical protein AX15_002346 [Amanita polypyramis BW_CC]|nr:hypothetical protein AX15_002346 [Amanita polypyramis BW_CC]